MQDLLLSIVLPTIAIIMAGGASSRAKQLERRIKEIESAISQKGIPVTEAPVHPKWWEPPRPSDRPQPPPTPPPPSRPVSYPQPQPAVAPRTPSAPKVSPPPRVKIDWEKFVGVKMFSWAAAVALTVAAVFFMRYSIEQGWLTPQIRMTMGLIVGVALLILCELPRMKRYTVTANALDAAGIAVLYATLFAARTLWQLIPAIPTFMLMALVTATAVLLSARRNSAFIALLGLLSGFATPFLLSTGENRPISLFSYLLLLNVGFAAVAARKRWGWLTALSVVFTTVYQWGWVFKFLSVSQLPLALAIFVVFPIGAYVVLAGSARSKSPADPLMRRISSASAVLPVFFAFYLAAIPRYSEHYGLLFGYLFLIAAGLAAVAYCQGATWLHWVGGLSTLLGLALWVAVSYAHNAWPSIVAIVSLFSLFYMAIPTVVSWRRHKDEVLWRLTRFVGSFLLFAFPVIALIEPACAAPTILFGAIFVITVAFAIISIHANDSAPYLVAIFFVVVTEAAWSYKYLHAGYPITGLSLFAGFTLLFLCVPWLAKRMRRDIEPFLQANFFALGGPVYILIFFALRKEMLADPWPMLACLGTLTLAIGYAALSWRQELLQAGGVVVGSFVLLAWECTAKAPWPATALWLSLAVALFSFTWFGIARRNRPLFAISSIAGGVAALAVGAAGIILPGAPPIAEWVVVHIVIVCGLLLVAHATGWYAVSFIALAASASAIVVWVSSAADVPSAVDVRVALVFYLVFIAYPFVLGRRVGRSISVHLAAIFASAAFFFFAKARFDDLGWMNWIGALPIAQAILMAVLMLRLPGIRNPSERVKGQMALVAGAALAFITVAIPLQLENEWVTIGWALQGAACVALYRKIEHRGLLLWGGGLLIAVLIRLVCNPYVFEYYPRSERPILNWYLYTYLVSALSLYLSASVLRPIKDTLIPKLRSSTICLIGGTLLLFLLLNIEIADYYSTGTQLTFNFSATIAQDSTYTIGWAVFAVALLAAGILAKNKPARLVSLLLMIVTVVKGFLHDLWRLGGLYRVGSFVGLAICLALIALALQRFVLRTEKEEK